jgi:hypothetical protein
MSQLTEQYKEIDSPPWLTQTDFVFRVWVSPTHSLGFQYYSLVASEYYADEERLSLEFPKGTVVVVGPRTGELYDQFCKERGRATMVRADGVGITEVGFKPRGKFG